MSPTDFAQTRYARQNREAKAERLVAAALDLRLGPWDLKPRGALLLRRQVRKHAGVDRDPSAETWAMALHVLALAVEETCLGCLVEVRRVRDPRTGLVTVVDAATATHGPRLHVRTCGAPEDASAARRRAVPPCRGCRGDLDPALWEADGLDAHATCAPLDD